ncbi:hypothetical protein GCM10009616_08170 [Microlunatus lacustris]
MTPNDPAGQPDNGPFAPKEPTDESYDRSQAERSLAATRRALTGSEDLHEESLKSIGARMFKR